MWTFLFIALAVVAVVVSSIIEVTPDSRVRSPEWTTPFYRRNEG